LKCRLPEGAESRIAEALLELLNAEVTVRQEMVPAD